MLKLNSMNEVNSHIRYLSFGTKKKKSKISMPFSVTKLIKGIALLNHIKTMSTNVIPSQLIKDVRKRYDW